MTWPEDAEGDVFRRLEEDNFDFSKPHKIDFNIDFMEWPPAREAMTLLAATYPDAAISEVSEDRYVLMTISTLLDHNLVIRMQFQLSELMDPYDGSCESWSVLNTTRPN
jgi:hypothetical protein